MNVSENHACKRARERYGADLTKADLAEMRRMIWRGHCFVESARRDGSQRIVVLYNKRAYFLVYSESADRILTFYPKGWGEKMVEPNRRDIHKRRRRSV